METEYPQPLPQKFENLQIKDEEGGDHDSMMSEEEEPYIDYQAIHKAKRRLKHEKSKQIVKDFLQQVEKNRFSEFPWPPDLDFPAYNYIRHYIEDFEFKEDPETARKFLDQVRKSWGYDVDCIPPPWMGMFLHPIRPGVEYKIWLKVLTLAAECVIDRINAQAKEIGKTFDFVRIDKAVVAGGALYLLTLTIKDVEANAEKIIRATVSMPPPCLDPALVECKLISPVPT